ncbi:MAG TPA: hypothetical protein VIM16_06265 [Mucilaginibacter sp.]|jgi:DNA sulfur modification protein DndD
MKIHSLELENFLSYYDKNHFRFGDGPTIIIGQNRTGKSKLFDAINWVLYNKAYHTDIEDWRETKEWKEDLVNNYAKSLAREGESVKASVSMSFEDEEGTKYLLTREYKIKNKGNSSWDVPRNPTLSLRKTDRITNDATPYWDLEAENQIKLLFPQNLSKYFLFQGENISQIMSLNNKSDFINALTDLSRIEIFDKAKNYADKVFKTLKKEFEVKEDSNDQLQDKKMALSATIDSLKSDLEHEKDEFENFVKERDTAKEVFSKKNDELKKYEECARIINEIQQLETQKSSKIDLRVQLIDSQKRNIFDQWMYAGTDKILKGFQEIYNKNKIEKKIPEPIRQEFVKEMLRLHKCLVCGNDAEDGTAFYDNIKSHLNEKALDSETELINKLSFVSENTLERNSQISAEIFKFFSREEEYHTLIKALDQKIKAKEIELKESKPADISEDELKQRNFAQLQIDRDVAKGDLDRFEERIKGSREKIVYITGLLTEQQKDYDSLVENSSNPKEKDRFKLGEKIQDTVTKFYNSFLTKLIADIESNANECFRHMTEKNPALSGKVKVDYDLKEVYTVDESGKRLININQANKVSLQIAFVAAVLAVSNQFWNTYFPFVADAPISALGGNNKVNTITTMMDIFKQSVIILKDDADTTDNASVRNDVVRALIQTNKSVQYAYELKTIGEKLIEQRTKVEILKQ